MYWIQHKTRQHKTLLINNSAAVSFQRLSPPPPLPHNPSNRPISRDKPTLRSAPRWRTAPESLQRAGSWRTRHQASHSTCLTHLPNEIGITPLHYPHPIPSHSPSWAAHCTRHIINTIAKSVNDALTILAGDAVVSRSRHHSRQADVRMRTKCFRPIWGQLVRGN